MGLNKSKLQGLILPAQSGKTRKAEEEIELFQTLNRLQGGNGEVNIWISANNKLLVEQTKTRLMHDLVEEEPIINGQIFSWMSGSKESNISAEALSSRVFRGKVDMVVVCANATRVSYLMNLLEILDEMSFQKNINIWIDEADKSIALWSKFNHVLNMPAVKKVTLVSATMESVMKEFGSLRLKTYETTHPECYRRLTDMNRVTIDVAAFSAADYVRQVLEEYKDTLVQPGIRAFIPGDFTKKSHEDISTLLLSLGFAVVILNGEHKEIRYPDWETTDLSECFMVGTELPSYEFNDILAGLQMRLSRYPLAITGYLCVERGITFQCAPKDGKGKHNGFLFDYGIIPPIADKAEAYQAMARLFGNIGHFPNYQPCTIYSNAATFKRVQNQEEIAVNLPRIMYSSGKTEATMADFKSAARFEEAKEWTLYPDEFICIEEANAFLKKHGCHQRTQKDTNEDGFQLSTTSTILSILSYDDVKRTLSGWSTLSGFDVKDKMGDNYSRMIVCYKDLENPESIVYIVRVIVRN